MGSRYAEGQHDGRIEQQLSKVFDCEASDLPAEYKLVLRYIDYLFLNPDAGMVDGPIVGALRRSFSDDEVVELGFTVLLYNFYRRFGVGMGSGPPQCVGLNGPHATAKVI